LQLFSFLCLNGPPPNSGATPNLRVPILRAPILHVPILRAPILHASILHAFNSLALNPRALDLLALDCSGFACPRFTCSGPACSDMYLWVRQDTCGETLLILLLQFLACVLKVHKVFMSHSHLDNPHRVPGIQLSDHTFFYFTGSLQYLELPSFLLQQLSQVLDIEGLMLVT